MMGLMKLHEWILITLYHETNEEFGVDGGGGPVGNHERRVWCECINRADV